MSRNPKNQSHVFQYIYSVKKVVHRKKSLALILIIAPIAIYAALVGIIQFRPIVQFIEQHSTFLQVIISFALVITSAYFSSKMYRNTVRVSGKPAMVELSRFLISPLEKYLWDLLVKECRISPLEIGCLFRLKKKCLIVNHESGSLRNLKEEMHRELPLELFLTNYLLMLKEKYFFEISLPSLEVLLTEFYSVLEKMNKEKEWDHEMNRLEESSKELISRIGKLEEKLKELIIRHTEEVRWKYETIEEMRRKYSDFQELFDKLVDEFCEYYMRKNKDLSIEELSWCYFDDLFNKIAQKLSRELEEMVTIWANKIGHMYTLISLLEEIRNYLKKEYKLTPSEQSLLVLSEQVVQMEEHRESG
jgi:hypothetical protein